MHVVLPSRVREDEKGQTGFCLNSESAPSLARGCSFTIRTEDLASCHVRDQNSVEVPDTSSARKVGQSGDRFVENCLGIAPKHQKPPLPPTSEHATTDSGALQRLNLEETESYNRHMESWKKETDEIDPDLYRTPAMQTDCWKGPRFDNRCGRRLTRGAIHGFHYEICTRSSFHEINDLCVCKLCHERCDTYLFYSCSCT